MELFFSAFTNGVALLVDPVLLVIIFLGTLWGVLGGGHPGGSATLTLSVMIPLTFLMTPIQAVAFLLAIMVGVNYGNSIPAVLLGLPGTPSAFLTAIDGYSLHRKGQTGLALGIMFVSSLAGQFLSIFAFVALVVPLALLTYAFLAPEYFALYFLGLVTVISLLGRDLLKGYISAGIGVAFSLVGTDPMSAVSRYSGQVQELRTGLEPIPILLGLLALSELLRQARQVYTYETFEGTINLRFPSRAQLRRCFVAILGGSVIGTLTGATPGAEATAGAVISYNQARYWSKHKEEFGKGSIEGIAANEAAQNAAQAGDMIPTLGLGIPAGGTSALVLAALLIHGIIPGPLMLRQTPEMLYAAVAGMLGATVFLVFIGWPIAKVMARVVSLDRSAVMAIVLLLILVGVYSLDQSVFSVGVTLVAGLVGYYMRQYGYSVAAAALGNILGRGLEKYLRGGILLMQNDPVAFVTRPVTAVILLLAIGFIVLGLVQSYRLRRAV
ncbi:MAG: tripartite tricarboxylate transporter permease [Chloroflexi bacterium]|nr:tripartite tricarboxylate transporter permease [Chloroflexota bacterium]